MKTVQIFFIMLVAGLTLAALFHYPGNVLVYAVFTLVFNYYLYLGLGPNAFFYETFLGIFLWLGFWFKFTIRLLFMDGDFHVSTGVFDFSPAAHDQALLVSATGVAALIVVQWLSRYIAVPFLSSDSGAKAGYYEALGCFYRKYRTSILIAFAILFVSLSLINSTLSLYQRGGIPAVSLPYGLSGVVTWLLSFGLASMSCMILYLELCGDRKYRLPLVLGVLEVFCSNVSMLSRGMILNGTALLYGFFKFAHLKKIKIEVIDSFRIMGLFFVLFIISVFLVNFLRLSLVPATPTISVEERNIKRTIASTKLLFVDRWVGIEAVMAVSASQHTGWKLWADAWEEKFDYQSTSFFDKKLIDSPYLYSHLKNQHYISLPGIIAFLFYPGSFAFLFSAMLLLGVVCWLSEVCLLKISGNNLILCSLLMQVVATRIVHSGYVPSRSYVLLGAIVLNIILIVLAAYIVRYMQKKN